MLRAKNDFLPEYFINSFFYSLRKLQTVSFCTYDLRGKYARVKKNGSKINICQCIFKLFQILLAFFKIVLNINILQILIYKY